MLPVRDGVSNSILSKGPNPTFHFQVSFNEFQYPMKSVSWFRRSILVYGLLFCFVAAGFSEAWAKEFPKKNIAEC